MTWRLPPDPTPDDLAEYPELAVLRLLQHAARAAASALLASNPYAAYGSYDGRERTDGARDGYGPEGYGTSAHLGRSILTLASALVDAVAAYESYITPSVCSHPEKHAPVPRAEEPEGDIPF